MFSSPLTLFLDKQPPGINVIESNDAVDKYLSSINEQILDAQVPFFFQLSSALRPPVSLEENTLSSIWE